jgi:hypothetical protein
MLPNYEQRVSKRLEEDEEIVINYVVSSYCNKDYLGV